MYIKELSLDEFNNFVSKNQYNNYHQSLNYALLKSESDYEYEMIGLVDEVGVIYGAAMVLVKNLNGYLYAYIPEGFITDYSNFKLVQTFTEKMTEYYAKEDITFIKINPSVPVAEIDSKTGTKNYTSYRYLSADLTRIGYTKLPDNLYFESSLPHYNAIIDLKNYRFENLSKNTKNKIRKAIRKGLTIEKCDISKIDIFNKFVKNKINKGDFHYNDYLNIFSRTDSIDFFLVYVDYNKYITNSQIVYEKEYEENNNMNYKVGREPKERNINKKINSDKKLLSYKNDITLASKHLQDIEKTYLAGAIVIKHYNKVSILISGFDKSKSDFAANYFLYNELINYYKNDYDTFDLNGFTGDFSKQNKYYGLNEFKLGFKPQVYEYVGEFDYIIDHKTYSYLLKKGLLADEFNKE